MINLVVHQGKKGFPFESLHIHISLVQNQDCVGYSVGITGNFKEQRNN